MIGNDAGGCLQVAKRHGQRIGDVVRCWGLVETEEQLDHVLHLMLLRAAVADDGAFDHGGSVLDDGDAGFSGGQERDAARLTELQRAAHVAVVKDVFDGDAIGLMTRDERLQPFVDWQSTKG